MNGLNTPIKKERWSDWGKQRQIRPQLYPDYIRGILKYKDIHWKLKDGWLPWQSSDQDSVF